MSGKTLFDSNVSSKELTNIAGPLGVPLCDASATKEIAGRKPCTVRCPSLRESCSCSQTFIPCGRCRRPPWRGATFPSLYRAIQLSQQCRNRKEIYLGCHAVYMHLDVPKPHQTWQASTKSRQLQKLRLRLVVVEGEGWLPNIVTFAEKAAEKVRPSHRISSAKSSHWICR